MRKYYEVFQVQTWGKDDTGFVGAGPRFPTNESGERAAEIELEACIRFSPNASHRIQRLGVADCGHTYTLPGAQCGATGYARTKCDDGTTRRICYRCAATDEHLHLLRSGKGTLYLVNPDHAKRRAVTNWSGALRFPVRHMSTSRHNFGGERRDFWFTIGDGHIWHGYQIGGYAQTARVKRTKQKYME